MKEMKISRQKIKEIFKQKNKDKKNTQKEMANKFKMTPAALSNLLSDEYECLKPAVRKILEELDVSILDIIEPKEVNTKKVLFYIKNKEYLKFVRYFIDKGYKVFIVELKNLNIDGVTFITPSFFKEQKNKININYYFIDSDFILVEKQKENYSLENKLQSIFFTTCVVVLNFNSKSELLKGNNVSKRIDERIMIHKKIEKNFFQNFFYLQVEAVDDSELDINKFKKISTAYSIKKKYLKELKDMFKKEGYIYK